MIYGRMEIQPTCFDVVFCLEIVANALNMADPPAKMQRSWILRYKDGQ